MSFDFATLITDRQKSDADYARALIGRITNGTATAEELAAWNAAILKGSYDYTDLNRVTAAMDEINSMLLAAGYKTGYQNVIVSGETGKLPEGYTKLGYIESSGTQYINTFVKPNQDTRIELSGSFLSEGTSFIFGVRTAQYTVNYSLLLSGSLRSDYGESKQTFSQSYTGKNVEIDKNKNICTVNSETVTNTPQNFQSQYSLFLFCSNDGGTPKYFSKTRITKVKIWESENLVRDFVPCKTDLLGPGLYDFVNNSFYGNSGSGDFLEGPEIRNDPYTWYEDDKPTTVQIRQYLANVRALRATIANQSPEVPEAKDMSSVEAANNIEKILLAIERAIQTMKQTYVPCGATACGGDYL